MYDDYLEFGRLAVRTVTSVDIKKWLNGWLPYYTYYIGIMIRMFIFSYMYLYLYLYASI